MKKFLVSWVSGVELGVYVAETGEDAILAAVEDAGYSSIEDARDFIFDDNGEVILHWVELPVDVAETAL
ncbi:MAG TPA: hypothetical protein DCF63_11895 [Planctomycetaceae bacterium]|nr:hypothetical protein [Planctomycetaceae bacterium]